MNVYDLYAIKNMELESARAAIEEALAIKFNARESMYRCGLYYKYGDLQNENFILQMNYDSLHHEWTEEGHQDMSLLFYVSNTSRPDQIGIMLSRHLNEISLLRRKQL